MTGLVFSLDEASSNWVRVWASGAPSGSELDGKIRSATGRVEIYSGQGGANHQLRTTFDRGGHYTFVAQEYVKGATPHGGGYQDSPDSAPGETQVGAESTLDLYIGQRLTSKIGENGDDATLILWVWNETVRATELAFQGELTPAIVEPRSAKAIAASVSSPVVTALAALVGESDPAGTMASLISTLRNQIAAHMVDGSVHAASDAVNVLPAAFASDPGQHLADFVQPALAGLRAHMDNVGDPTAGPPFGAASGVYHSTLDRVNAPLIQSVSDQASAYRGLADAWRAYEAHRVSSVHVTPDTTHALGTAPKLLALHVAFLSQLAANTTTAPPGQSNGAMRLIQKAGFEES